MVIAVILPEENVLGLHPIEQSIRYLGARLPEVKFIIYTGELSFKEELDGENIIRESLPKGFKNPISRVIWWNAGFKNQIKKYGITHLWSAKSYAGSNNALQSFVFADDSLLKGKLLALRQKLKDNRVGKIYSEEKFAAAELHNFKSQSAYIILPTIIPKASISQTEAVISEPYFVCYAANATTEEMMQLLKAFSFFKKRMSSTTKLVIITENEGGAKKIENFEGYKHKVDIQFISNYTQTELNSFIAASIGFINFSQQILSFFSIYYASNVGVAIIAKENDHLKAVFADCLAYYSSQETLAAQMINLYKDENLRLYYKEGITSFYQQRNIDMNIMRNEALLEIH